MKTKLKAFYKKQRGVKTPFKLNIMEFKRYKQNLSITGEKVLSYGTHVATIADDKLFQLGYWSMTTQKHINYVANELDLTLIK